MLCRIVLVSILFAAGCTGKDGAKSGPSTMESSQVSLLDTQWDLKDLNGKPVQPAEPMRGPGIQFSAKDGRAAGNASVNRFSTRYTLEGSKLTILPGALTRMAGPPELMAQEDAYMKALPKVDSYRIEGNRLELLGAGEVLARFEKR